jgi:hypothetical protein
MSAKMANVLLCLKEDGKCVSAPHAVRMEIEEVPYARMENK